MRSAIEIYKNKINIYNIKLINKFYDNDILRFYEKIINDVKI